jgi:mono/diheme cytochrome c family protein
MTWFGRTCAIGAVILGGATVAIWDRGPQAASNAAQLDGADLFQAKGCASCHDGPDSTAFVGGFPPLVDATEWAGQRRPDMTADAYLAESITNPNVFISPAFTGGNGPTTAMPRLALTPAEVEALVDYLLSR